MKNRRAISLLILCYIPLQFWGTANEPGDSEPRIDPQDPFYSKSSSLVVGAKGEESLQVSVGAQCGQTVWVFDHAELQVMRNRFGDARLVEMPEPGCTECRPLIVRWYHEPTGYLDFDIHVWRKEKRIECAPTENKNG